MLFTTKLSLQPPTDLDQWVVLQWQGPEEKGRSRVSEIKKIEKMGSGILAESSLLRSTALLRDVWDRVIRKLSNKRKKLAGS